MSKQMPIATPREVRAAARRDLGADRKAVAGVVLVNALASAAGLVGPWLLGRIIDTIQAGSGDVLDTVDRLALGALLFTVVQTVLGWWALKLGYRYSKFLSVEGQFNDYIHPQDPFATHATIANSTPSMTCRTRSG